LAGPWALLWLRKAEKKKPTGGIEPPTFRLQSECSTTKLSRRTVEVNKLRIQIYRDLPIAQLAERETVDGLTTDISRSLVRIRVGRLFGFCRGRLLFWLSCRKRGRGREPNPTQYTLARIAQLVERWSNKPLVLGSIPNVSTFSFFLAFFSLSTSQKVCANRESNPALKLGKLQCYRYTIGADYGIQRAASPPWINFFFPPTSCASSVKNIRGED
jgi:hypothetical protein